MRGHRHLLPIAVSLAAIVAVTVVLVLIAVDLVGGLLDRDEQVAVTRALVWPDGRRVTVDVQAGMCDRAELGAEEDDRRVALTLTLTPPRGYCALGVRRVQVSTVLRSPLNGRDLTDASTGRRVRHFDGRLLLATGYLPPGYQRFADTPFAAGMRDGPNAWTRTYIQRVGTAELDVTQTSPPARLLDDWNAGGRADVNGRPAEIRTTSLDGRVTARAVLWTAHGQGLAVISRGGGEPLPEQELLRVARGLHR